MLEIIMQSEDYKKFIQEYDPFVIFLGGSRIYQYASPNSDWDLIAFTSKYKNESRFCKRIVLNDIAPEIHAHILVVSLEMVLELFMCAPSHPDKLWESIGLMYNLVWSNDNIIYKTEIPDIFYELMNPDNHIKEHIVHGLVVNYGQLINHMIEQVTQGIFDIHYKIYYYFLLFWELYSGDRSYQPLIKKVRLHISLTNEEQLQYVDVLRKILKVAEDYDIFYYFNDYLYLEGLIWQHFQSLPKDQTM